MDFNVAGSAPTDCRELQLAQSKAEDEEGSRSHSTVDHRIEHVNNNNELMDVYSKGLVMHGPGLSEHLMRQEIELMAGGQEHSHSHFDIDVELVHEQSHSRFDDDEQLEVQLRFDLSSLDETHMLLDANGPRDSHWGVDFMRQEQSLTFHAASEENKSLLHSDGKLKDIKSYKNCETWSRASSSHEDDHLYFAAVSQAEVNSIANAFELKGRKLPEDCEELEAGQSTIGHVNQEDANSWFDLSGKEHLQPNTDARPEVDADNCDERKLAQKYMLMDEVRPHLKVDGLLRQENAAGHCSSLLSIVHTQEDRELDCTPTMIDLIDDREVYVPHQDCTGASLINSEVSKVWHAEGMQQPAQVEVELRSNGCGGLVQKEMEDLPGVTQQQSDECGLSDKTNSPSEVILQARGEHAFEHTQIMQTPLEEVNTFSDPNKELEQVFCDKAEHRDPTCIDKGTKLMQFKQQVKGHLLETVREQQVQMNALSNEQFVESSLNAETMSGTAYLLPGHSASKKVSTATNALRSEESVVSSPTSVAMSGTPYSLPGHSASKRVSTLTNTSIGTGGESMDLGGAAMENLCSEDDFSVDNLDVQVKKVQEFEFRSVALKVEQLKSCRNEETFKGGIQATSKHVDLQDRGRLCLVPSHKQYTEPIHTENLHAVLEVYTAAMEVSELEEEDSLKCRPVLDITPEAQVDFKEMEGFPLTGSSIAQSSASEQQHNLRSYEMLDSHSVYREKSACNTHSEMLPDAPSIQGSSVPNPDSASYLCGALEREFLFKEEQDDHVDHIAPVFERDNATESAVFACAKVGGVVGGLIGGDEVAILPGHSKGYVEVPCSDVQEVHSTSGSQTVVQEDVQIPCKVASQHGDIIMTDVADCRGTHAKDATYNDNTEMASIKGNTVELDLDLVGISCNPADNPVNDINGCSKKGGTVDIKEGFESREVDQCTDVGAIIQDPLSLGTVARTVGNVLHGDLESRETDQCTDIGAIIQDPLSLGTLVRTVGNEVPHGDCGGSEALLESSNITNRSLHEVDDVGMADFSGASSQGVAVPVEVNLSDTQNRDLPEAETQLENHEHQQREVASLPDPFSEASAAATLKCGGEQEMHLTEARVVESLEEASLIDVTCSSGGNMHASSQRSMMPNTAAQLYVTVGDDQPICENVNSLDCKDMLQLSLIKREATEAQSEDGRFPVKSWKTVEEVSVPLLRDGPTISKGFESESGNCETLSLISMKEGSFITGGNTKEDKNKPLQRDDPAISKGFDSESGVCEALIDMKEEILAVGGEEDKGKPLLRDDSALSEEFESESGICETLNIISAKEGSLVVDGEAQEDKNNLVSEDDDPGTNCRTVCEFEKHETSMASEESMKEGSHVEESHAACPPTDSAFPSARMTPDDDNDGDNSDNDAALKQLECDETRVPTGDDATLLQTVDAFLQTEIAEISKVNDQSGTGIESSSGSDNPAGLPYVCEGNANNRLSQKEGEVGPDKIDSAVCQQTEHTLVSPLKVIASDENDAMVQIEGGEADPKINAEQGKCDENTIKADEPAIDILEYKEGGVGPDKIDSAVYQQTEHTLLPPFKVIASDENDVMVQIEGGEADPNINAEQEKCDENIIKADEPSIDILEYKEVLVAAEIVVSTTDSQNTQLAGMVKGINSCPQEDCYSTGSVIVVNRNMNDQISGETSFDHETMEIQNNVPAKDAGEKVQQNAYFEMPVAGSQSVSDLDSRVLRVKDASQKQGSREAIATIGASTEISMALQGKEAISQVQGNHVDAALQNKTLDARSACVANCANLVPLADKEKGLVLSCSSPSDGRAIQTELKGYSGTSLGKDRSRQKDAETLPKSHFSGRDDVNPSNAMSIMCEQSPQEIRALHSGLKGSLAASDNSLSNGGNKFTQGLLSQAGKLPIQTSEKITKPLNTSTGSHVAVGPLVIDINSFSALNEPCSINNMLDQRDGAITGRALLGSTADNPLITQGISGKGQLPHPRQQITIPDLNVAEEASSAIVIQPFTDSQQIQLRAQILVYGSLIQGALPDEALMIPAFRDINGARQVIGREAMAGGMIFWEKAWRAAAERIQGRTVLNAPKETAQSTTSGLLSTPLNIPARITEEGARMNCFSSNPSLGNVACSVGARSLTFPKGHTTRTRQNPTTVTRSVGSRTVPAPFLTPPHSHNVPSSTRVVPLPLNETTYNPQGGKPSQVNSQLAPPMTVFTTSPIAPFTPGSTHWIPPAPFPGPPWLPPLQATGFDASVPFTSLQPFAGRDVNQDLLSSRRSTAPSRVPFVPVATTFNSQVIASVSNVGVTFDTVAVQKSSSGASRLVGLEPRSRKRKKSQLESSVQPDILSGSLSEGISVFCGRTSVTPSAPLWCSSSSEGVTGTLSASNMPLPASSESLAVLIATSHLPTPVVEAPVLATTSIEVSAALMIGSSMPTSLTSEYQLVSAGQHQGRPVMSESAIHDLKQAKLNAEEATSIAASAVRYSESMWSQLQSHKNHGIMSDKEVKLTSSAVTIAAAASVAKAAAAAARVAYEAALQAKLMGEEALEFSDAANGNPSGGKSGDIGLMQIQGSSGIVRTRQEFENITFVAWEMPSNCKSVIATAREAAKKRFEAASTAQIRAHNIESVVRAAELATTAVSHAGAVVAMGDPVPFTLDMLLDAGPDGLLRLGNTDTSADVLHKERVNSKRSLDKSSGRREKCSKGKEEDRSKKDTLRKVGELRERGTMQPYEDDIRRVDSETASPSEPLNINKDSPGNISGNVETMKDFTDTSAIVATQATAQISDALNEGTMPAETEVGSHSRPDLSCANADQITEGSMVEVLSDEEGLRGVWFSAKVLGLENGKAFVIYDELLCDDDNSLLEEWIDLGNPSGKAPRVRLAHPVTRIKFEGTRKRRRAAMGNYIWSVGDRVDAWIRDGWWEGEVLDKSEEDETKVKVYFPGEGDTAFIKSWNLRPSLIWKDGCWLLWTDTKLESISRQEEASGLKDEAPLAKRQKLDMASGDTSLSKQLKVDRERNNTLKRGKEKITEVRSEENERLQGLNVEAVPSVGNIQPENMIRTRREGAAGRGVKEAQANEGPKVVFGVPKPTKKRKFIEVSKHYGSNRLTRNSPKAKAHGTDDRNKIPTCVNQIVLDGVSKVDDGNTKKLLLKQPPMKARKDDENNQSNNVLVRHDKEKRFPGFGMGPRKEISSHDAVASIPSSGKTDGVKLGKKNTPSDKRQSDVQRSNFNIITTMSKDLNMRKQPISSRNIASSTDVERVLKNRHPLAPTKEVEKDKAVPIPFAEVLEPRRSSRRIQPTSKLLEGLQSTPKLGKIHYSL